MVCIGSWAAASVMPVDAGPAVHLRNVVVTSHHAADLQDFAGGLFYVQDLSEISGIQVVDVSGAPVGVRRGDVVTVNGTLEIDAWTNEAYVLTYGAVFPQLAFGLVKPLGMGGRALGGVDRSPGTEFWRPGVTMPSPSGPHNKGLLVRSWGVVTHVNYFNGFFYVDDGSHLEDGYGAWGVRVSYDYQFADDDETPIVPPSLGSTVEVTGLCGSEVWDGQTIRLIRLRDQDDIRVVRGGYEAFPVRKASAAARSVTGARIR